MEKESDHNPILLNSNERLFWRQTMEEKLHCKPDGLRGLKELTTKYFPYSRDFCNFSSVLDTFCFREPEITSDGKPRQGGHGSLNMESVLKQENNEILC